jgi:predicted enzyme related to lactoylglutathione lyase
MDRVVHFEIPVDDVERARGFYGTVFDWGIVPLDDAEYTLVFTTPVDDKGPIENRTPIEPGAINGGLMQRSADTPAPLVTIQVDSIDASLKKVEAEGGSVVKSHTSMGELGAYAYLKDSEGNVIGLFEQP